MKSRENVLKEIKELVKKDGFFYALCMILTEDFVVNAESLQDLNIADRVSDNEAFLLLWFLIQDKINFSIPTDQIAFVEIKKKIYELLKELHDSFRIPFMTRIDERLENGFQTENYATDKKKFFWSWEMMIEPIFYSGSWVYDFQYLDYLEAKYKYDEKWLIDNKGFNIKDSIEIVTKIKELLHAKKEKINFKSLKETPESLINDIQKKYPKEDVKKGIEDMIPILEIDQYMELALTKIDITKCKSGEDFRERLWMSFYELLIDLLVIRKSELSEFKNIDIFFDNFSIELWEWLNTHFTDIWKFNILSSQPVIKLDEDRYFFPIIFKLFEAVYESPYYWMTQDKKYKNKLSNNRGNTGEEITYNFLSQVFWLENTFQWVTIKKWKKDVTDIDILCVLWSKALCIQVKSKKLTELSRIWDTEQIQTDFKWAIQDAYNQWLVSRKAIMDRDTKFIGKDGNEVILSEQINEVYIMWVTTENYPALTHQANILLEKDADSPNAIFSTIFDLELMVHYLKDPYDFLYYIRQRTDLMDYFIAEEEMVFLGYHLDSKLWKLPDVDFCPIDNSFGALIDRNYYPYKLWLPVSDRWDAIKNKWKNEKFDRLFSELKSIKEEHVVDIIFSILDLSWDARDGLMDMILRVKSMKSEDGKDHNFSLPWCNISFVSWWSDNLDELTKAIIVISERRKYKDKSDIWIWLWSLKDSWNIIDTVFYHKEKWKEDSKLDKAFKDNTPWTMIDRQTWRKLTRKSPCVCGSWKRFKRCCWDQYFW